MGKIVQKSVDSDMRDYAKTVNDERENPYQTAIGQKVVSISEDFETRLSREGRPRGAYTQGANATSGVLLSFSRVTPSPGCVLYPISVIVSCDVDATLQVQYQTNIADVGADSNGVIIQTAFVKAGTPWHPIPKGKLIYDGGYVQIGAIATANGKVTGSIDGVEVSVNA